MTKLILIIGGKPTINWFELFANEHLHGEERVEIEMAMWDEIHLVSYSDSGLVIDLSPSSNPLHDKQRTRRTISPNFVLVRSANRGVIGQDWRNALYGLMHSNVPSLNTLQSLYNCQEKPIVYGKLREVQKRLGRQNFPLINQAYYASWKTMTFADTFPLVAKVGTAHAGFGKAKIENMDAFEDFRSVMALQNLYVTAEPFIEWDYDFRIQKIGSHYRAFRRVSSNWKGKGMNQSDEDIEVTPQYKQWIDEASKAVGMGEDCICALDGVHSKVDDKEYLIELNDSAIGFVLRHEEEDLQHVRDLVMVHLTRAYPKNDASNSNNNNNNNDDTVTEVSKEEKLVSENESLKKELEILKVQLAREKAINQRVEQEQQAKGQSKSRGFGNFFKTKDDK